MDAACWNTFGESPFFGDYNGRVMIAWEGNLDNVKLDGTGGDSITAECQQAYSYFKALGSQKQVGLYRPNFIVSAPISYNSYIYYDFEVAIPLAPDGIPSAGGSIWNTAIWNNGSWYGGANPQRGWNMAQGMGVAASVAIGLRANADVLWVSTDYSLQVGGIL